MCSAPPNLVVDTPRVLALGSAGSKTKMNRTMALARTEKVEIIDRFSKHGSDTGSAEVQIALLTKRINGLSEHFKLHHKDHHRGLLRLVGKRRRMLDYLARESEDRYRKLIKELGLRK